MAGINLDYTKSRGFQNSFGTESDGFMQGDAQDDPAVRLQLSSGVIASTVTVPMYPGLGIIENIPTALTKETGSVITLATDTVCTGFTVVNQAHHGIITPTSDVPQYPAGASVHFYRIGSNARIPLKVSDAVVALANGTTPNNSTKFKWDPVNNCIDVAATDGIAIKLLTVSLKGNMTSTVVGSDITWEFDKPIGVFLI